MYITLTVNLEAKIEEHQHKPKINVMIHSQKKSPSKGAIYQLLSFDTGPSKSIINKIFKFQLTVSTHFQLPIDPTEIQDNFIFQRGVTCVALSSIRICCLTLKRGLEDEHSMQKNGEK